MKSVTPKSRFVVILAVVAASCSVLAATASAAKLKVSERIAAPSGSGEVEAVMVKSSATRGGVRYLAGHLSTVDGSSLGAIHASGAADSAGFGQNGWLVLSEALFGQAELDGVKVDSVGRVTVSGVSITSVAGESTAKRFFARFDQTGALDSAFGSGGVVLLPGDGDTLGSASRRDFVLFEDGGIIAPITEPPGKPCAIRICVTKLLQNGSVDTTFGQLGVAEFPVPITFEDVRTLTVHRARRGHFVAAARLSTATGSRTVAIARFSITGLLDNSSRGTAVTSFRLPAGRNSDLSLGGIDYRSGRLFVGGAISTPSRLGDKSAPFLVAADANGRPLARFGKRGIKLLAKAQVSGGAVVDVAAGDSRRVSVLTANGLGDSSLIFWGSVRSIWRQKQAVRFSKDTFAGCFVASRAGNVVAGTYAARSPAGIFVGRLSSR